MFERIRIVLVETSHPGNIGASARVMKNMGLSQLVLVKPKWFPHADANALASGANDILENAEVVSTLEQALAPCQLVLATSARLRELPWPTLAPMQVAGKISEASSQTEVAIVFGRENSGLTNDELSLSHYHIVIPSVEEFSSLNLASAVAVVCYALRSADVPRQTAEMPPLASVADVQNLYQHLQSTLTELDFIKSSNPKKVLFRLQRLFNRAQLEPIEVNILHGILSAIDKQQMSLKP